jgi:hypothetical protein
MNVPNKAIEEAILRRARELYEEDARWLKHCPPWDRTSPHWQATYIAQARQELDDDTAALKNRCEKCGERSRTIALALRHKQQHENEGDEPQELGQPIECTGMVII